MDVNGNLPTPLCRSCGHPELTHLLRVDLISGGLLGACAATVDPRHPATGGDTLTPCKCKGFVGSADEVTS